MAVKPGLPCALPIEILPPTRERDEHHLGQLWTDSRGQTIAQIVRPGDDREGDDWEGCLAENDYGLEFMLPDGLFAAVALHLANLIYEEMIGVTSANLDEALTTSPVQS